MKILESYFEKDLENKIKTTTESVIRFTGNVRSVKNTIGEKIIQTEYYIQEEKYNI